ncbi:MAG: hypothetical protein KBC00_01760 [Candidatus Levybacteria bacterium]|nr:hypothetical protein [Candidatus Levybacteria bacterium]MBP9815048.1 hypothetical protein [Candidatus Levybacteria bacterium]
MTGVFKKKLTLILFLVSIVIFIFIVFFVFLNENTPPPSLTQKIVPTQTPKQESPTMMVSFSPNTITINKQSTFTSSILFDSYGIPVSKITIALSYDPLQVSNVKIISVNDPSSALSYSVNLTAGIKQSNPEQGTISQSYLIPTSIPYPKGKGIIAKVTGKLTQGTTSAIIKIDQASFASSPQTPNVVLGKVNLEINTK